MANPSEGRLGEVGDAAVIRILYEVEKRLDNRISRVEEDVEEITAAVKDSTATILTAISSISQSSSEADTIVATLVVNRS